MRKKTTKQKQTVMHVLTVYGLLRVEFNFGPSLFFLPIQVTKKNPSEMRTILVPYLTLKQVCQTSGLGVRNSPPETPIWSAGRLRKTCRRADM